MAERFELSFARATPRDDWAKGLQEQTPHLEKHMNEIGREQRMDFSKCLRETMRIDLQDPKSPSHRRRWFKNQERVNEAEDLMELRDALQVSCPSAR